MTYGTVNVDSVVNSDGTITGGLYGFKNRFINGAMMIDQRNAGASVNPGTATTYITDRWQVFCNNGSLSCTAQQSSTAPNGFRYSLYFNVVTGSASGSTNRAALAQVIEGLNMADFGWGTAWASAVTLSFWVRSSKTGQFGGSMQNGAQDYSYPFSFTINSANTWEFKTINVAGPTSGTWNSDNTGGIRVAFDLGMGSSLLGTAGAWASGDYRGATGDTSVVATTGANFYITGVQLEKGSTATSFDYRPYGTELALCQRYFYTNSYVQYGGVGIFSIGSGSQIKGPWCSFPVTMRASPTVTISGTGGATINLVNINSGSCTLTSISASAGPTPNGFLFSAGSQSGGSQLTSRQSETFENSSGSGVSMIVQASIEL